MTENALITTHGGEVLLQESRSLYDGLMVVRETLAPDLTVGELQLFALVAYRSGLDPFARQIYAVKRQGRMTIQTGIDGYRSIAARTGEYDGQDEPTFGPDCPCGKGPRHPESATVAVYRKGMGRAVKATAYWHEYVPDPGPSGKGDLMWRKMPHVMLAKVSEALALRKAFPWDPNSGKGIGSDVYTDDEMAQADNPVPTVTTVQERIAARSDLSGASLRYFADRVREMDPETIRRVRGEMFPEAKGVADLSDEQRFALLERLIALEEGGEIVQEAVEVPGETEDATGGEETGLPPVQQAPATEFVEVETGEVIRAEDLVNPEEVMEGARMIRRTQAPPEMVACEAPSPFTEGIVCLLPKGHRAAHRAGSTEAWPR